MVLLLHYIVQSKKALISAIFANLGFSGIILLRTKNNPLGSFFRSVLDEFRMPPLKIVPLLNYDLSTKGTALGFNRDFTQAFFAFLGGRIGWRPFSGAGNEQIHGLDNKEKDRRRNQQE